MTARVPARAPAGPPLIGESITVTPASAQAFSISATTGPPTVQVFTRVLIAVPASSPSGPSTACRKIVRVGSETTTVSQASARSFGEAARRAWRSSSGRIASSRTSWTHSSWPASSSRSAMGRPMLPMPR